MVDFLCNSHSFHGLTRKTIHKYVKMIKKLKYTHGQIVYSEGDPCDFVYIVKKGEFEMEKRLSHHPKFNKAT